MRSNTAIDYTHGCLLRLHERRNKYRGCTVTAAATVYRQFVMTLTPLFVKFRSLRTNAEKLLDALRDLRIKHLENCKAKSVDAFQDMYKTVCEQVKKFSFVLIKCTPPPYIITSSVLCDRSGDGVARPLLPSCPSYRFARHVISRRTK